MANWSIKRIASPTGVATIDCLETFEPVQVTLVDNDTQLTSTIQVCKSLTPGHECDFFAILRTAGYTPGDWDGECPP